MDLIKSLDIHKASSAVGGIDNLFKILDINSPMDFLHLFDDLDVVQSEEEPELTLFRYKPKHNLMIYNKKSDYVYISYDDIWSVLEDKFGLNYYEIRKLTVRWVNEVYNLRGITTGRDKFFKKRRLVG